MKDKEKTFEEKYAKYYDLFYKYKDYNSESEFIKKIFEKYGISVRNILNLGCGTGKHEEFLSEMGFNVHGIDISTEMIRIAKSKNLSNCTYEVGDTSDFNLNRKFDACISMFAAFGYLTENNQIENSLKKIRNHLNPNGLVIIEVWNGLGVLKEMPTPRKKEIEKDKIKIIRQSFPKFDAYNQKVNILFKVNVFEDDLLKDSTEEMHKMRFFFPQEIKKYLEEEGFELLEICQAFKLDTKIDENNWDMVVIARLKN